MPSISSAPPAALAPVIGSNTPILITLLLVVTTAFFPHPLNIVPSISVASKIDISFFILYPPIFIINLK